MLRTRYPHAEESAIDLLYQLRSYKYDERISIDGALRHAYLLPGLAPIDTAVDEFQALDNEIDMWSST